jgi:hypothetical protein
MVLDNIFSDIDCDDSFLAFLENHSREMLLETVGMLNLFLNKTKAIGRCTET